jgi:hypothetical protein
VASVRTLVAVLVLAAAAGAVGCGDDESESTTLTFDSPTIDVAVTDEPPPGASPKDVRAFVSPLTDESGAEVGRLDGMVVVTDVGKRGGDSVEYRAGTIQFTLDEGNIVASGIYVAPVGEVVPASGGVERPIVGGTGKYVGANGVLTQTALEGGAYRNVLKFETDDE